MGTHLELQIAAPTQAAAEGAEAAALAEAARLEAVFSVFDPTSNLRRWRTGSDDAGPELTALLEKASCWQVETAGAFNPLTGILTERWLRAVDEGVIPSDSDLAELAASIADPRFTVTEHVVVRESSCEVVDLNAIAKGHVVDLVAEHVLANHDVSRLVVNAGGDLVHRGTGSVQVAVEDPHTPYDNAPPIERVVIANAAIATSGRARRWFEIGGQRYSRVLDPRTGASVSHTASATVIAPTAAVADVLATAASVQQPAEVLARIDELGADGSDAACLVIDGHRGQHRSAAWSAWQRPG